MKRGQAANEAAMIIGLMTLFLIAFLAVISDRVIVATNDRNKEVAEDLADVIESELVLAANAQEGYSRLFQLPPTLDGIPYTMIFHNKSDLDSAPTTTDTADFTMATVVLQMTSGDYNSIRLLPDNIIGSFRIGNNYVRKLNGFVSLNAEQLLIGRAAPVSDITISPSNTFVLTATAACVGNPNADCDDVSLEARYLSGEPVPLTGTTSEKFTTPKNPQSCGQINIDEACTVSWTIEATSTIDEFEDFFVRQDPPGQFDQVSSSVRVTIVP